MGAWGLAAGLGRSDPVDLSAPIDEVGVADSYGYLSIWRQVNGVGLQLGKDAYLPLRYQFSTEPGAGNGKLLGPNFYVPMFEARSILIREKMMRANLPCGKSLFLRRDTSDITKFQTVDRAWTGVLGENGDDFTITRSDGWTILYHKSRLSSITTDDKRILTWTYGDNEEEISMNGQVVASVDINAAGHATDFVADRKRYEIGYAKRPITAIAAGQVIITELDDALTSFTYPEGKTDNFVFSLTPDRIPTLTLVDRNNQQTAYTWDVKTGHVATETGSDSWTYTIGEIKEAFAVPTISRTDSKGLSESIDINNNLGVVTQKSLDGITVTTTHFRSPGPLYDKPKQISQTIWGQTTVIRRYSYDELGRVIRKVDNNGFSTILTYGSDGKIASQRVLPPADPALVDSLQAREKTLIAQISAATEAARRNDAVQQLAFFYIFKMGDISKAVALLPQVTDSQHAFNINLQAILGDKNLARIARVARLKDLLIKFPDQTQIVSNLLNIYDGKNTQPSTPKST